MYEAFFFSLYTVCICLCMPSRFVFVLDCLGFVLCRATPGALATPVQAPAAAIAALAPADLKQLSPAAPVDAAVTVSRGGARAPVAEPAKSQTIIVGIYFFLWCVCMSCLLLYFVLRVFRLRGGDGS